MSADCEMKSPTTRPAMTSDLPGIVELLMMCGLPSSDLLAEHLATFFVATRGDRLVGVAGIETFGGLGLLRSLAVTPEVRGGGLAKELVGACEDLARARFGVCALYLLTTTAADYFLRRGYEEVPRESVPAQIASHPQFRGLCPASARSLRRVLVELPASHLDHSIAGSTLQAV